MTISIPDTLTTDNSEKYIVSIRLRVDFLFPGMIPRLEEVSFIGKRNSIGRSLSFLPLRSFSSLMSFLRGLINGLT